MTDDIIRMAREAGSIDSEDVILTVYAAFSAHERNRHAWTQEHWTQYEHAIADAEREACAKLVLDDAWALTFQAFGQYRAALAAAIRGRSHAGN